jgi:hypothetical protein
MLLKRIGRELPHWSVDVMHLDQQPLASILLTPYYSESFRQTIGGRKFCMMEEQNPHHVHCAI